MKVFQKYYDSGGTYQGTYILMFKVRKFRLDWFTDCGDWFLYLYWFRKESAKYVRFSSAGFMKGCYK